MISDPENDYTLYIEYHLFHPSAARAYIDAYLSTHHYGVVSQYLPLFQQKQNAYYTFLDQNTAYIYIQFLTKEDRFRFWLSFCETEIEGAVNSVNALEPYHVMLHGFIEEMA